MRVFRRSNKFVLAVATAGMLVFLAGHTHAQSQINGDALGAAVGDAVSGAVDTALEKAAESGAAAGTGATPTTTALPGADAIMADGELLPIPKVEDMASALLSSSGISDELKAASIEPAGGFGSDSEVWAAFLNAARDGLEGGSMEKYAKSFGGLEEGDASSIFNSAVPGEAVNPNSLLTMTLGTDFNKQIASVKDTMGLALGLDPEKNMKETMTDPAFWLRTMMGAIKGDTGAIKTDCAWTASADYQTANLFFPDAQSVYHLMLFPQFGPADLAMIEGEFPDARYFSVQTYDENFSPITGLQDREVEPYEGVNSFARKSPLQIRDGRFKIVLSKDGKRGFPNELPVSVGNFSSTSQGYVMFRLYGVDPLAKTTNPKLAKWGYKNPPTISLRTAGSLTPATFDQGWKKLSQCPDSNAEIVAQAVNVAVDSRLVELNFKEDSVSCKIENVKDGFMLMSRERTQSSRAPFVNADGAYLMACANSRPEYIKNNELIGVVKSYFPRTPYSKFAARFVGQPETYDMRYASLSVYDLKPPGPVMKTFSDGEIRDFYYDLYGAELWEEHYQRNVSVVVASSQKALDRCRMDTSESLVLTLEGMGETEMNGQAAGGPEWWSIVYRELIPQGQIINASNAAQYGMKEKDIYKTSIQDARNVMCTEEGDSCDRNPYRAASIMKEHYPRVEWFTCSPTGVLAVADPVVDFQFDTRFDSKALVPRASQYFYQFCPDDVSQALVKAMGPSTITVQGYLQGATTAPANSLATFPLSISSKQPEFVVGISIKAKDPIDAYFKGEVEVCGYSYVTDSKWKCIDQPPADDEWLNPDFDDAAWTRASFVNDDYHVPTITDEAKFITWGEGAVGLYCRVVLPNPTYLL